MLKIKLTDINGDEVRCKAPVSIEINCEQDVPCDDIRLVFPYTGDILRRADFVTAYSGDEVVFRGKLDEVTDRLENGRALTSVSARSLAGMLVDNEAEPVVYRNPAADFIYKRHLEPYGIYEYSRDSKPFFGTLQITKGMSEWQVLESFCKSRYSSYPRITSDGRALLDGAPKEKEIVFGDDGDIGFFSYKESFKRHKLLSEVRLRTNENQRYSSTIANTSPDCRGITKVRYVDACSSGTSIGTADRLIRSSNSQSRQLVIGCKGCHLGIMGRKAQVRHPLIGNKEGLVVRGIRYRAASDSEATSVVLSYSQEE